MRVGVIGAAGRMGRETCRAVEDAEGLELVATVDRGEPLERLADADTEVAVDFTTPDVVGDHVAWLLDNGIHAVVGTTGWDDDDLTRWRAASDRTGANAVVVPNFAIGAVLMVRFAEEAVRHLAAVEIVELHHDAKRDAPSGTAKRTAERLREVRGAGRGDVPIHSVRLPGLVAHQEVILGGQGQTLTIRHDTVDRTAFMPGVLLAAREAPSRRGVTVGLEAILGLGAGGEAAR